MIFNKPVFKLFMAASFSLLTVGCLEQGVILNKPGGFTTRFNGDPSKLNRIELRVTQLTELAEGESIQLSVFAFDDQGNPIDPTLLDLDWQAADGTKIEVDENGRVKGLLPFSSSEVTVTDTKSKLSDSGLINVTGKYTGDIALLDRILFAFPNQTAALAGDQIPYYLIALDSQGRPIDPDQLGALKWDISDKVNFSINPITGVVTALTNGANTGNQIAQVTATHTASGKVANGTIDMIRGSSPGEPAASNPPSTAPSAAPSVAPSTTPSVAPSAAPSVAPSTSPTPSALPTASASVNPQFPGDPTRLKELIISPSVYYLDEKGDSGTYFVQAKDSNGQFIDPSKLTLVWSTNKPVLFKVEGMGKEAKVTALDESGYADLMVKDQTSGIEAIPADIRMGSGGGGGGGGSAPVTAALTEPVIDAFNFSYAGGSDGKLYAFDSNQDLAWTFTADGAIPRNPAKGFPGNASNPRLFFGTKAGSVYGVDVSEGSDTAGTESWSEDLGSEVTTAPIVDENNNLVVFGTANGNLHLFTLSGNQYYDDIPSINISDQPLLSSPILNRGSDDIYALTQEGELCSVDVFSTTADTTCTQVTYDDEVDAGAFTADVAMMRNNEVVAGNEDGNLYVIGMNDNGTINYSDFVDLGETPITNPAVVDNNNMIYVPVGGALVAISNGDGLSSEPDWSTQVCNGSSKIIGAPLLVESFNSEYIYAYVNCSDGAMYQILADENGNGDPDLDPGDVVDTFPLQGTASRLIAGPSMTVEENNFQPQADVDGDNHLFVGGSNGQIQVFDLLPDYYLHRFGRFSNSNTRFTKFRVDQNNSGVYDSVSQDNEKSSDNR